MDCPCRRQCAFRMIRSYAGVAVCAWTDGVETRVHQSNRERALGMRGVHWGVTDARREIDRGRLSQIGSSDAVRRAFACVNRTCSFAHRLAWLRRRPSCGSDHGSAGHGRTVHHHVQPLQNVDARSSEAYSGRARFYRLGHASPPPATPARLVRCIERTSARAHVASPQATWADVVSPHMRR